MDQRKHYEYKRVDVGGDRPVGLAPVLKDEGVAILTREGAEGWRFVSWVTGTHGRNAALLEREAP